MTTSSTPLTVSASRLGDDLGDSLRTRDVSDAPTSLDDVKADIKERALQPRAERETKEEDVKSPTSTKDETLVAAKDAENSPPNFPDKLEYGKAAFT